MTKQDLIIACMLAAKPTASTEEATAFAAEVWNDNFSHIDFLLWNSEVPENEATRIISEARRRQVFDLKELIDYLS